MADWDFLSMLFGGDTEQDPYENMSVDPTLFMPGPSVSAPSLPSVTAPALSDRDVEFGQSSGFRLPDTDSLFRAKIDEATGMIDGLTAQRSAHYKALDDLDNYAESSYKPLTVMLASALGGYLGGGPIKEWSKLPTEFSQLAQNNLEVQEKKKRDALYKEIAFDESQISDWRNVQQQMGANQVSSEAQMLQGLAKGEYIGSPEYQQKRAQQVSDSISTSLGVHRALGDVPGTTEWDIAQKAKLAQEEARAKALGQVEIDTKKSLKEQERSMPVTDPGLIAKGITTQGQLEDASKRYQMENKDNQMAIRNMESMRKSLNGAREQLGFGDQGIIKFRPQLSPDDKKKTTELIQSVDKLAPAMDALFGRVLQNGAPLFGTEAAVQQFLASTEMNMLREWSKSGAALSESEQRYLKAWMPAILTLSDRIESLAKGTFDANAWRAIYTEAQDLLQKSKAYGLLSYGSYLEGFKYDRSNPSVRSLEMSGQMPFNSKGLAVRNEQFIQNKATVAALESSMNQMLMDAAGSVESQGQLERLLRLRAERSQ